MMHDFSKEAGTLPLFALTLQPRRISGSNHDLGSEKWVYYHDNRVR